MSANEFAFPASNAQMNIIVEMKEILLIRTNSKLAVTHHGMYIHRERVAYENWPRIYPL